MVRARLAFEPTDFHRLNNRLRGSLYREIFAMQEGFLRTTVRLFTMRSGLGHGCRGSVATHFLRASLVQSCLKPQRDRQNCSTQHANCSACIRACDNLASTRDSLSVGTGTVARALCLVEVTSLVRLCCSARASVAVPTLEKLSLSIFSACRDERVCSLFQAREKGRRPSIRARGKCNLKTAK